MNNVNRGYWYCPTCGSRIYEYEKNCSACGASKVDYSLPIGAISGYCLECGSRLAEEFKFCPSCGKAVKRGAVRGGGSADYETTNEFLKIVHACNGGIFAVILAVNAIWCAIFGIFYGLLCMACSIGGIVVQVIFNKNNAAKKTRVSVILIVAAIVLMVIAVVVMIVSVVVKAQLGNYLSGLLF